MSRGQFCVSVANVFRVQLGRAGTSGNRARSICTSRYSRMRRFGHAAANFSMSFATIVNGGSVVHAASLECQWRRRSWLEVVRKKESGCLWRQAP